MAFRATKGWISIERVEDLLQAEPVLIVLGLSLASYVLYRFFLTELTDERHKNLKAHFSNLGYYVLVFATALAAYWVGNRGLEEGGILWIERFLPYMGLIFGSVVFVKTSRILLFEYLFLGHMKEGVPLLLINIFTLLASFVIGAWLASFIFGVQLAPLMATSAVFSIILGLAIQDTLGNLFAGIALQLDKPFEIGDWVEIFNGSQKLSGQVLELSWRATVLVSFTEEFITLPNRVVAQSQISNFSIKGRPIIRSQVFRIPFGVDFNQIKGQLLDVALKTDGVLVQPSPLCLISETTESWVSVKLIYYITNYGKQYLIADALYESAVDRLRAVPIPFAANRLQIETLSS